MAAERRARVCRLLIAEREIAGRLIDKIFVSNPLWDILLDIYLAEFEGRLVYQTCLAPGAPPANPHRQSRRLARLGVVERMLDPMDNRRINVRLTPEMRSSFDELMDSLGSLWANE
ncbi:hypothetical protein GG804_02180 [Sphingomonas histidinilytica]|uniref:hypothetical protein n=1 Tax=Sphingomonadales TaxID=204457 RepID=UPI00076FEE8B|nr:hypothetical protein [Rhizorhabdus histidinilytica]AMK23206.1 hypothetical protein K426_11340 [Sphingobium sp. TKS]MBO9375562.1 hypothetical protein [Rhizorhabdus histidinilytica]